jgi:hypothetical protein
VHEEHKNRQALIRASFRKQAEACADLGSPFMKQLCTVLADRMDTSDLVGASVLDWKGDPGGTKDALALRLCGCLHALVLSNADSILKSVYPPNNVSDDAVWAACSQAFKEHSAHILEHLQSAPQTNEIRRSSVLVPGFLTLAALFKKPLVLSELGASAGLNMLWDTLSFNFGGQHIGPETSPVHLVPDWSGPLPPIAEARIADRGGCDVNPLLASLPEDRLRLLSYLWADQTDRIARTRAALDLAVSQAIRVEKADAIDWLEHRLAVPRNGMVHVIYHSIAWQYFPADRQARGRQLLEDAGSRATPHAPLAHLQMESDGQPDGAAITLQIWPHGEKHVLGRGDYHGRWVRWSGLI